MTKKYDFTPIVLFLVSLLARSYVSLHGSPFCYQNDEHWIFGPVFEMVMKHSWDPHWYHYPPLMMLVFRAIIPPFRFLFPVDLTIPQTNWLNPEFIFPAQFPILYIGRLIADVFGSLTVVLLYFLIKQYSNQKLAILFSFLYLISHFSLMYGSFLRPEPAMIFFVIGSFYLLSKFVDSDKISWIWLSGLSLGLATSSKYNAVYFIFTAFFLFFVLAERKKNILLHSMRMSLGTLAGLLISNPYVLIKPLAVMSDISEEYTYYKNGGPFDSRSHIENLMFYLKSLYEVNQLFLLFYVSLFTLLFIGILGKKLNPKTKTIIQSSLFFIVTYILILSRFKVGVERNLIVIYPFIFLISAIILHHFSFHPLKLLRRISLGVLCVSSILMIFYGFDFLSRCNRLLPQDHARIWFEKNVSANATLLKEFETPVVDPVKYQTIYAAALVALDPKILMKLNPDYIMVSGYIKNRADQAHKPYYDRFNHWLWVKTPEFEDTNSENIPLGIPIRIYNFRKLSDDFKTVFKNDLSQIDDQFPKSN